MKGKNRRKCHSYREEKDMHSGAFFMRTAADGVRG